MDVYGAYQQKLTSAEEAVKAIRSGDWVEYGYSSCMIFPMVFAAGLEPAGSVGLTFLTLPNVFNVIPLGRVIGVLFYFGFYIAAFTSTLGVVEALTGTFTEQFDMKRGKAIGITMLLCTC